MVGAASFLSVMIGVAVARLAERLPPRTEMLETVAGLLLIGGFAAIGCALPSML
jgi:hypothetical protein